jgi:hypothetical protein
MNGRNFKHIANSDHSDKYTIRLKMILDYILLLFFGHKGHP